MFKDPFEVVNDNVDDKDVNNDDGRRGTLGGPSQLLAIEPKSTFGH